MRDLAFRDRFHFGNTYFIEDINKMCHIVIFRETA